jgi:hypothetical protein
MIEKCDEEVFANGQHVFTLADIEVSDIEKWVEKLRTISEQRVDWYFFGGRACVLCLGDTEAVVRAIKENLSEISSKTEYWRFV